MRPTSWRGFLRSNGKDASKSKLRLQVEALEDRRLMAKSLSTFPLEADTIRSAVAPETISLSQTPYSPTLGYGWTSPMIKASARTLTGPRQRNTKLESDNNFRVDLPNGLYSVTVTGGDPRLRNQLSIWAEGQAKVTGQRATSRRLPNFQVVVNDGQLNLSFANGGRARFNLRPNALKIAPVLLTSAGPNLSAEEGGVLSFTGTTSKTSDVTYSWDFGDGNSASGSLSPEHQYRDNQAYTVTLLVRDPSGAIVKSTSTVDVTNAAPTASVSGPYTATAGQALVLSGSATDPSPADTEAGFTYTWNFGDGSKPVSGLNLTQPNHTYAKPGTYTVRVTAADKDNATSSEVTSLVTVAAIPDPILTASAGGSYTSTEGASKSLTATAAGGNGIYSYAWDLDNNGTFETAGKTVNSTFPDNGIYTVRLRVADSAGQSAYALATINVTNVAPTASANGPYKVTAGQPLKFAGSASDPSPVDSAAGFTYTWNFGDYTPQVSGKDLSSPTHIFANPGTYRVFVTATDKNGATGSASIATVIVAKPADPTLTASAGGSYQGVEGSSVSLTATAAGGNGTYAYAWDLDNNGSFETVGKTVTATFSDNGTYSTQLRVTDSAGQSAFSTATITVANVTPTASVSGPYSVTAGQSLTLAASATDPGTADTAAGFSYTWNFGDGSAPLSGTDLTNPNHTYTTPGTYTVLVTATDKDNATSSAVSTTVTVVKPPDPLLIASAGERYQGLEGSSVSVAAMAAGGNGVYSFAWDLDNNGTFETAGKTATPTFPDNGTYTVKVRVTDTAGQSALGTATITIANVTPTAFVTGPYTATAGQALALIGSATDPSPADTTAGFLYTWNFGDGSAPLSGAGLTNPNHTYTTAGAYTVLVTVTDKDNATSFAVSTTVTVVKPPDPILTASAGGSYTSTEGASKSLTATAAGGNGIYSYAWDLDNNGSFETSGQTVNRTFLDNGTYTVKLRVADSAGQSAIATATITVANVAPTASVSGPYSITAGQSLTLAASATDPGTADTAAGFTYTWNFGDGSAPLSGAGLTNPNHTYTTPGTYTILVTATDKDNVTSPAISTTVTVIKPPDPILLASAGERYQSLEGSAVSLTAMASGGNGVYTYVWDLDNNGSFETAGKTANPTFPDNGTYTVKLRVADSAGQFALASTTVTVANVAPTVFGNGSYSAIPGQKLTLHASATDPSLADTSAGFIYTWNFGDGSVPVSGLGLSSPSHTYATLGVYTVVVTATDKDNATSTVLLTTVTIVKPLDPPLTASAGGPYTVQEGSPQSLTATAGGGNGTYIYAWDLDNDGSFETVGQSVSSSFADNGTYTVRLKVADSAGQTAITMATVTVPNVAPTASAGGPYTIRAGRSLTFGGSAIDPSLVDSVAGFTYTWTFGDGTPQVSGLGLTKPAHIYTTPGSYTVVVTATDKDGGKGIASATVNVTDGSAVSDQLNKPVLNQSNFAYLGSFRMPTSANGWSTAYSNGGFTHRYVDGKLQFLTTSHVYSGGLVYEVNYPGIGTTGVLPQAQVVKNWGDVYTGEKWVANDGGSSELTAGIETYGLYYDQNLDRLYWSYGHWYNASNPYNPSFGYSVLDDSTGIATGVGAWSLTDRPEKFNRGGTLRIPQWFADQYTGGKSLGVGFGGYFSIVDSASFGPALAAVSDPDIATTPDRSSLDNTPLVGYPSSAPDRAHRNPDYNSLYDNGNWNPSGDTGYWTWSDDIHGGSTWIDTPELGGVLFIAKVGQGQVWYEGSTLHSERGAFEWMVYDPKDLAAVASGAKQQWEIQPKYSWTDSTLPLGPPDQAGWSGYGSSQVGGVTFDPTTNRLYVQVTAAWQDGREWYPEVYVYQLS